MNTNTIRTKVVAGALCVLSLGGAIAVAGPALADSRAPTEPSGDVQPGLHQPQPNEYKVSTTLKFHNLKGYIVEVTPYFDPCQCSKDYTQGVAWLNQDDQNIPLSFTATESGSCFFESSKAHWFVQLYDRQMNKHGRYEIWLDEGCMDYYAGLRTIDVGDQIDAHARPHKDVHDEQYIYFGHT